VISTLSRSRHELDFSESFKQRMALLEGLSEEVLHKVATNITKDTRLMRALKYYGYKTAILSGGFTYFGKYLQKELGIDYVHANELEIIDDLTGTELSMVKESRVFESDRR
jgi:phosphoserine phosphatase